MRHPIVLLIAVGLLLAVNINLAKAAHDAGASALLIALVTTAGAGLVLLGLARARGHRLDLAPRRLAFYAIAGAISYALPNLLVFAAAGQVGPAFAAMLHALVPGITYLVAIGWGLDRLAPLKAVGLIVGLAGAVVIIVARLGFSNEAETAALLFALIAPLSIALGNVVRSRYWPAGAGPLDVAPPMLLFAAAELALLLFVQPPAATIPDQAVTILLVQILISAAFYALYFRLQHLAGPVYLSQIGYVATAFALPTAVIIFADRVNAAMLAGVALVMVGIVLVRPSGPARRLPRIFPGPSEVVSPPHPGGVQ